LGIYGRTEQLRYPVVTFLGKTDELKVKIKCFVGIILLSFLIVILLTFKIPCSDNSVFRSSSVQFTRSISDITPRDVFSVACGVTFISILAIDLAKSKDLACKAVATSINRSPERSFFTDFGEPAIPSKPFSIMNGEIFHKSLLGDVIIRNFGPENETFGLVWVHSDSST